MARTKWGPDLIGLWSHMRTLVTQPNSNLRKTFNSSPKQNCDSEPPLPSNDFEQPIPTSSNASPPNSAGKNGRTRYGIASAKSFATSGLAHGNDALHGYFCSTVCAKRDRRRRTRRNLRQHPL